MPEARRRHVYILTAAHDELTQGEEILGVYTSERKAKAAARTEADTRLRWVPTTPGATTHNHGRFSLSADAPREEDEWPWHYVIHVIRPQ